MIDLKGQKVRSMLEIAKGTIPGHSAVNKFGHNPAVATGGEDVWSGGGAYAFFPTTAQTVQAVSSSAEDEDGETGAITMQVYGLDANWEEQTETVTLELPLPMTTRTAR